LAKEFPKHNGKPPSWVGECTRQVRDSPRWVGDSPRWAVDSPRGAGDSPQWVRDSPTSGKTGLLYRRGLISIVIYVLL